MTPLAPLLVVVAAAGGAVQVAPTGDGGGVRVQVENRAVHGVPVELGAVGGSGARVEAPGYAGVAFTVHCGDGPAGPAPALEARVDGRPEPVAVPPVAFPGGPPSLFLSPEPAGKAALATLLEGYGRPKLERLAPEALPDAFGALRFAPFLFVSSGDLAAIPPGPRRALRDAVAAGATLVVATGEGGGDAALLAGLAPVTLGESARPGPALRGALPRTIAARALTPTGPGARVTVRADERPVVVEAALGLGTVRVVAVGFDALEPGPVADAALGPAPDAWGPLSSWLGQQAALPEPRTSPFHWPAWLLLAGVPLLGLAGRRFPRVAAGLAVPLFGAAVALPPAGEATRVEGARVLYVPFDGGALAVGTLDLSLGQGGGRAVPAGEGPVAFEDADPTGACLVTAPKTAAWIVSGDPGERRRLTFYAVLDAAPAGGAGAPDPLPDSPGGVLAGARLARVAAADAVLPVAPAPPADALEAWRAEVAPPAGEPVELAAPAPEPAPELEAPPEPAPKPKAKAKAKAKKKTKKAGH